MTSAFGAQKVPMMTSADNVGEGWHEILRALEEQLNLIDPDYTIQQVKEKFGGLRYYASTNESGSNFHDLIRLAEEKSEKTCEVCGRDGKTESIRGWWKTLCEEHYNKRMEEVS